MIQKIKSASMVISSVLCLSLYHAYPAEPETSSALPKGMKQVWADEFNDDSLNRTKWSSNYYSTLDFAYKTNREDFLRDNLPQPDMEFTGHSIILKIDNSLPVRAYWKTGRKISSIQTYDWLQDRNMMPDNIGGYFEALIKRDDLPGTKRRNIAFWFDSPGPDMRYFIQQGDTARGVAGIRPPGQVFEIDLCEQLNTEIVLHGKVSPRGKFEGNIGHFIIPGDYKDRWVRHGMLWTPAGLKFYIDGKLVAESWDRHDIKSPNHAMVMFFGAYGYDGMASIEVDYARHYQWDTEQGNCLPNGGFEYGGELFPWEGRALVTADAARSGDYGLTIQPGDSICQYVYLDPSAKYSISFYGKGKDGKIKAEVYNIEHVKGTKIDTGSAIKEAGLKNKFTKSKLTLTTPADHPGHKRTAVVVFKNISGTEISLDDVRIEKR